MRRKREERRRKNGGLRQLTPTHKAQDECCYLLALLLFSFDVNSQFSDDSVKWYDK